MRDFTLCIATGFILLSCQPKIQRNGNKEIEAMNEKFFNLLSENNGVALDYLFTTNKWLIQDEVTGVKQKLDSLVSQLGSFKGSELIACRGIGEDYLLYSFLAKYERQPLRFILIYYKPTDKWQVQNFQFDYDLEPELKEAASMYRLPNNLPFDETK